MGPQGRAASCRSRRGEIPILSYCINIQYYLGMKKPITPFKVRHPLPVDAAKRAWVDAFLDAVEARNLDWYDPEAVDDDASNAYELVGKETPADEAARVYVDLPATPWVQQAREMSGTNFA